MLAAAHRMRESESFGHTVRSGRRAGGRALVLHLLTGGADPAAVRVGFVVSKAVGDAVTRNRVRRRLRHLVKERLSALPPGSCAVVRALPAAANASSAELGEELDRCLARVGRGPAARTGAAS